MQPYLHDSISHMRDIKLDRTVVDSRLVSDKSPRRVREFKWRLRSVSLIPGECGGRNVPTRPLSRPAAPPLACHFGCIPDVGDITRQTAPSHRQLRKYDRDVLKSVSWRAIIVVDLGNHPPLLPSTTEARDARCLRVYHVNMLFRVI